MVPRQIARGFNVGRGRSGRQYRLLQEAADLCRGSFKGRALGAPSPN